MITEVIGEVKNRVLSHVSRGVVNEIMHIIFIEKN